MKQFLVFIGGMITGALILYSAGFRNEILIKEEFRKEMVEKLSESLQNHYQDTEVQFIEVKGKKGLVTIHTGMTKDSVRILLGKPDEVRLNTFGNSIHEDWGYKITNKYGLPKEHQSADLQIGFEDGKLKDARQD